MFQADFRTRASVTTASVIILTSSLESQAITIISSLTDTPTSGVSATVSSTTHTAAEFTTDNSSYQLTNVTALIQTAGLTGQINASLFSDIGGLPNQEILSLGSVSPSESGLHLHSFQPVTGFTLDPSTTYHVVLSSSIGSSYGWSYAENIPALWTGLGTAPSQTEQFSRGVWKENAPALMYSVEGTIVPEPTTATILITGGLMLTARRRKESPKTAPH